MQIPALEGLEHQLGKGGIVAFSSAKNFPFRLVYDSRTPKFSI